MESLRLEPPDTVTWSYDQEVDTLYISFDKPQPALTLDLGSGLLVRYLKESGQLVGFTITGLKEVLKEERRG